MEVAKEFASFDLERTLRGLMIVCGIDREEIETLLRQRRKADELDRFEGPVN